ncbi:MAG: antibiotic biosynthesis monooxygenase [Coriobacteriia bacterium]|nr:antibiotic biosynthesis monooxygenase [Coriobacteriia bacterium]
MTVYTSGDWLVMPGHEQEFVDAWLEFAHQSNTEFGQGGWGMLLRDKDEPRHFISVGSWPDERAVEQWRASHTFRHGVESVRIHVEDMTIRTLDHAAEVGRVATRA